MFNRFTRLATLALAMSPALLPAAHAQTTASAAIRQLKPIAQSNRISPSADFSPRTRLANHLPGWFSQATQTAKSFDLSQTLHLTLVLSRSAAAEAGVESLLAAQQNPSSPLYHQWVTPEQLGTLYGPTDADLNAVTSWITSQGLQVDSINGARTLIEVSGAASIVANAFVTSFANFQIGTDERFSATSNPSIPAALTPVLQSVRGLSEAHLTPHLHMKTEANPRQSSGSGITSLANLSDGSHTLLPNDFATIYDVASVYSGGNKGATIGSTAQHIAIVGRSRISSTDLTQWESLSGLSTSLAPVVYVAGIDPGTTNDNDQAEATLDVERTLGTAPGAITDLILAEDTNTVDGVYTSAAYNVNTLKDPVLTLSFGLCEVTAGSADFSTYNNLFQTGAAEGITIFVSSGDSGADGCLTTNKPGVLANITSANALCGPYVTCVGGTQFADTANPSAFWSSTQSASNNDDTALGYIPEGAWNEPNGTDKNGNAIYVVGASGGAPSSFATKPSWQTGSGTLADGKRDTNDVAFPAAVHDGYLSCLGYATGVTDCSYVTLFGGTSAAAPAWAGVAALVNTATGSAHGLLNPLLYALATSTPSAFHDVTVATSGVSGCTVTAASMCNNSTPGPSGLTGGAPGYLVGAGYDIPTGLGSIDVAKFITAAQAAARIATTITVNDVPASISLGSSTLLTATVVSASATGTVTFFANGTQIGSPVTLTAGVATYTYTPAVGGNYAITATYSGDTTYATSTTTTSATLVVNAAFKLSATNTLPAYAGVATTEAITLTSTAPFAGSVNLSCAVAAGTTTGTCQVTSPVTLASGGTASSTLTVMPTGIGTLSVTVTGVNGTNITAVTVAVTAAAPFSLSSNPGTLNFTSGATTGNTSTITLASVAGFTGAVNLACSITASSAAYQPTCSLSPTSVTGSGTSVLTIKSTTAVTQSVSTTKLAGFASTWSFAALLLAMAGLLIPVGRRRSLRAIRTLPLVALLGLAAATLSGCGSGGGNSIATPHTPVTTSSAGAYVVTITGTSATNSSLVATTTVGVTIN